MLLPPTQFTPQNYSRPFACRYGYPVAFKKRVKTVEIPIGYMIWWCIAVYT